MIVIYSCWQYVFLSLRSYRPSLRVGPLDYILCPHRADVRKSLLDVQHWCVHV